MQRKPLPITLVMASADSGGLFHDAIVVRSRELVLAESLIPTTPVM